VDARFAWFEGLRLVSLVRVEDAHGVRHTASIETGWNFLDLVPTDEASALLRDALLLLAQHQTGDVDPEPHERGLTRGPIMHWAHDDDFPSAALARIAAAWGSRWDAVRAAIDPKLPEALRDRLRGV
jgi:hypothetical protein